MSISTGNRESMIELLLALVKKVEQRILELRCDRLVLATGSERVDLGQFSRKL